MNHNFQQLIKANSFDFNELMVYEILLRISFSQSASVAELVDALDSKSSSFESEGSIPSGGTNP